MRHHFVDRYSNLDSLIHRLDPRTRILTTLSFVLAVVATPLASWPAFILYAILVVGLILLSRLPLLYALKRSVTILPFVLMTAAFLPFQGNGEVAASCTIWRWHISVTYDGLNMLGNTLAKAWLSSLGLILLSATVSFNRLLKGLEHLGIPRVMVMILSFMYRYIFVLVDEAMRMQRARDSRSVATWHPFSRRGLWQIKSVGSMIGTLFIRSYDRAERVYMGMLARGFDGEIRTLNDLQFSPADPCFAAGFLLCLVLIALVAVRSIT